MSERNFRESTSAHRHFKTKARAVTIVIGIDEAGLGPNLGPLVIAATVWDVPDQPEPFDFWQALATVVARADDPRDGRVVIGDSKRLYQSGQGLHDLERGVLIAAGDESTSSLRGLLSRIGLDESRDDEPPWCAATDIDLPRDAPPDEFPTLRSRWSNTLAACDCRLIGITAAIIHPREFNRLLSTGANKSEVASRLHMRVLASILPTDKPALVYSDKHGGRNRYAAVLQELGREAWIDVREESATLSHYRQGDLTIRFEPRAEVHLPVALASMTAKYLRELQMDLFNRYWIERQPGLRPTQGYPVDARRFWNETEPLRARMGIAATDLWRNK